MQITTIVVDDMAVDRYLVKRKLSGRDEFGDVLEVESGSQFLEQLDQGLVAPMADAAGRPLVLLDINMPGLDGFETARALEARVANGLLPSDLVVMMFTSSSHPQDRATAAAIPLVCGYIVKPIEDTDVETILDHYTH
ncbi:MAG: response regulator [Pseudomonadota bacterium]